MATLTELTTLRDDPGFEPLLNKVREAVIIKAADVINAVAPPAARLAWAKGALGNANSEAQLLIVYMIGNFGPTLTVAQILGAADVNIQTAVDDAVDNIYA